MHHECYDLFPTRVWVFQLEELAPFHQGWIESILQWQRSDPSLDSSNRQGWTSPKTLFDRSEFAPLKEAAERCLALAFEQVKLAKPSGFRTQAWVNMQDQGGFNHFHNHGTAALSGAFYLKVPEGSGDIVFRDPRAGIMLTGLKGDGANCFSVTTHTPREGEFVVFPGWLEHAVDMNASSEKRISIAINSYLARP